MKKQFTVIAVHTDNGQIVCHDTTAHNGLHAFAMVVDRIPGVDLVVAIEGCLKEGDNLTFPGEGPVSRETILAQPDVFGQSGVLSNVAYVAKVGGKLPPAKPEVYCWGASKALVTRDPPKGGYSPSFI